MYCDSCAALLEENERLRKALEKVEWDGYDEVYGLSECLWCGGFETKGHTSNCERQAALAPKESGEGVKE